MIMVKLINLILLLEFFKCELSEFETALLLYNCGRADTSKTVIEGESVTHRLQCLRPLSVVRLMAIITMFKNVL